MDWQLIGLTLFFVTAGIIPAVVSLLGFTRTEKVFGIAYAAGFASLLAVLHFFIIAEVPELRTKEDVESWLATAERAREVADYIWWFCAASATAFYVAAVPHIWRERSVVWKTLRVKTPESNNRAGWRKENELSPNQNDVRKI